MTNTNNANAVGGRFVHVVGIVNLASGKGEILYVNPATVAVTGGDGSPDVMLVIHDAQNKELANIHPVLRVSSCHNANDSETAMIQEDLPFLNDMVSISLLIRGNIVATFVSGESVSATAGAPSGNDGIALGMQGPKLVVNAAAATSQPGISYTVQVRPTGDDRWSTIAVGRATPDIEVDVSQFPGVKSATMRVLRTTGFTESLVAEKLLQFGSTGNSTEALVADNDVVLLTPHAA